MSKTAVPTNKRECESLLKEIEHELVSLIPKVVQSRKFREPAYGLLMCYIDLTAESFVPFAAVLPEKHRAKCVANRDVGDLWRIAELPVIPCPLPERHAVAGQCNAVYEYLSSSWDDQDEFEVILPFRRMIYRVCLALNKLDWSKVLPVTDDFTVMASDWSAGYHIEADANASVPRSKRNVLLKQGFFFNPEALPKPALPTGSTIKSIRRRPAHEQADFWIEQLEALYSDADCEAQRAGYGAKQVVKALVKLGEVGGDGLLQFLEAKASIPEWTKGQDLKTRWAYGTRTETLGAAIDGAKTCVASSPVNERRLWDSFEAAVKANEPAEFWGSLPMKLAFCIKELFQTEGRAKYRYLVTSDYRGQVTSLDQIRKQRSELGPK